jgi:hypothetical protein
MRNNLPKILEYIWLATSILCLITAIHQTFIEGISKSYLLFIFAVIAFAMYKYRNHVRKTNQN